ncbi:dihydrodipicolinate synthase family protein [Domibacillus mangrovi]|uniref:Dihydrodipicolinate synthase family protein n=1 Tax=Domibacillus mangrovi TaxID=1714354 RepID=A0A1Q5NZ56_9BACI|nr:dihydrodipicolinate synthase family protein [Domibacillus mangrovi]OKL35300.1 dihydrodipicolinate synthase family protein [Domibacillus mangrovi]
MKNFNVAIPTPFHDDESLYLEGFNPIVHYLTDNGIDSLLVSATTGEQNSMSIEERIQIIDYFNQQKFENVELMFGVSATRTKDAITLIKKLEESVFDSILIQFPPYIQPTQQQAISYINELLQHTTKNVVLYNNPFRTGFELSAESLNTLISQKHPNLAGIKEESDAKRHHNTNFPEDFIMFAGGDVDLTEKIMNGCNGLSSMVGNVYPQEIKQVFNDLLMHKPVDLWEINHLINEVTNGQAIVNIKNHYNSLGINAGTCRSPIK